MKRVKTGCRNCRKRHKKCDEQKPTCSSCLKKGEACQWPMKGDRIRISDLSGQWRIEEAQPLSTVLETAPEPIDSAILPDSAFKPNSANSPEIPPSTTEEYDILHNIFRDYMFLNAFSSNPLEPVYLKSEITEINNTLDEFAHNYVAEESVKDFEKIISPEEEIYLLNRYVSEIAPWLDMFDHRHQFTSKLPLMVKERALLYAILTIASRQEEKFSAFSRERTFKLYEKCLTFLIPKVKEKPTIDVVSACVILCCFQMMASSSPSLPWRQHLQGCAELFNTTGINGFSDELKSAVFWCFARMDVSFAIAGKETTVVPCERWLPCSIHEARKLFIDESHNWNKMCDYYANYSVFLLSRVANLIFSKETANFDGDWLDISKELSYWWENRPEEMKPVVLQNPTESCPFPRILYCVSPAISGNQLFHTAVILLMTNKPRSVTVDGGVLAKPLIWHAKQIVGISLTNNHHGCLINSLQPIYIAGKLLSHPSEHEIIVDLLYRIEQKTGWSMTWRATDLQQYWTL